SVAERHGLDVCQMALAYVNTRPFLTANIIGATNMEQLKSNIDSIDLVLAPEVIKDIGTVYRDYPMVF
ncbi:MAG: aldo/keto reductase, partial [Alphaproteobacteria bacterium]